MTHRTHYLLLCGLLASLLWSSTAQARTVYRCTKAGTVSLSTAPEPGSKCVAKHFEDGPKAPNLMSGRTGSIYRLESNGVTILTTRAIPGARKIMSYTIRNAPEDSQAHVGIGPVGKPRLDAFDAQFQTAARRHHIDEAWLRAIAHVESGFQARALSPKGAQGVMQLMPFTAQRYAVVDPFNAGQSIGAGAQHLAYLLKRYQGDTRLAAAAYNAGEGAVAKYNGIPPYRETQAYVAKVQALKTRYTTALQARKPQRPKVVTPPSQAVSKGKQSKDLTFD